MRYVAYWMLTDEGWQPSFVFSFDADGNLLTSALTPMLITTEGWRIAQIQVKRRPEDRRLQEIDKGTAEILEAEIHFRGSREVGAMYDFKPNVYVGIYSGGSEAVDHHEPSGYARILKNLEKDYYLVKVLGLKDGGEEDLVPEMWEASISGKAKKKTGKLSGLKLGEIYVFKWHYGLTAQPKRNIKYLRNRNEPEWNHFPDDELDIAFDDDEEAEELPMR